MYIKNYIQDNDSSATEDFLEGAEPVEEQVDELKKIEDLELEEKIKEIQELQERVIKKIKFPKQWLFESLIYRNTVNVMDGLGSTGKSTLALQLALVTITQREFLLPCFSFCRQEQCADLNLSNVLYLTTKAENPFEFVQEKIDCICSELNIDTAEAMPHFFLLYENEALLNESSKGIEPTNLYELVKKIISTYHIELLVIDPLSRFLGTEENNNKSINTFYNYLERLNTTILIIHHQPKSVMNEKIENTTARGASAIRENARCRLVLKNNTLLIEKNNYSTYQGCEIPLEIRNYTYSTSCQTPLKKGEEIVKVTIKKEKGGNGNENKEKFI